LNKVFCADVQLEAQFTGVSAGVDNKNHKNMSERVQQAVPAKQPEKTAPTTASREQFFGAQQQQYKKKIAPVQKKNEMVLDVSDESKWKMASMLLRHFPGVVTEI